MLNEFSRTELVFGEEAMLRLQRAHVLVFGIGGVGSYCTEALARAGIASLTLVDNDTVSITNINRQLIALQSTVGERKVDVMKRRILDINPHASVTIKPIFITPETLFDLSSYDYIVDAIDTVSAKLAIIEQATKKNIPIISCMGAGNKLDPTKFEICDIYKTTLCPLARVMRRELRKRNIQKLTVVYSTEKATKPAQSEELNSTVRRQIPGSVSFVPPVAGLIAAGEVIRNIARIPLS